VAKDRGYAKFWIEPEVSNAFSHRLKKRELREIERLVIQK
jgi:hypothetical protein